MKRSMIIGCLVAGILAWAPVQAADWVVASVLPLSGTTATTGNDLQAGANVAFNAVNNKGGISGRKIRLVTADNADQVPVTLAKARELLNKEHPIAFLVTAGSAAAEALIKDKMLANAGVPLVGPKTGSTAVANSGQGEVFLTRATYADEVATILRHCAASGMKRIAVVYQNDSFGQDALATAQKLAPQAGVQVVASGSYESAGTDVIRPIQTTKALEAVLAVPHQAVLLAATSQGTASFSYDYIARGGTGQRFALSSSEAQSVVQRAGIAPARGLVIAQVVPSPRNESQPIVRKLISDLRAGGAEIEDVNPTPSFMEGYIAAQVLIEGLRRAGPTADSGKLMQSLQGLRGFDLGGYAINYDGASRSGSHFVELAVISGSGEAIR